MTGTCAANGKATYTPEYCDENQASSCTFDYKAKGVCTLGTSEGKIKDNFNYFSGVYGGNPYTDNCPYVSNTDYCYNKTAKTVDYYTEYFADDSRCFRGIFHSISQNG